MQKGHSRRAITLAQAIKLKYKNSRKRGDLRSIRSAAMEALEGRTLLSGSTLSNGLLTIVGSTTQSCQLTAYVVNNGKSIDASANNGHAIIVPFASVKEIQITGGSGNDYIYVDSKITVPVTIHGGNGNDTVRGGGGSNVITEGNGSDWIDTRGVRGNSVTVGNGNDVVLGNNGNDTIVAGNGNDTLDGAGGNDSITAGSGNDSITGDAGNDVLVAGNGRDIINGGLGNDSLTAGSGISTLVPGSGTNVVKYDNSADTVVPSAGKNTLVDAAVTVSKGPGTVSQPPTVSSTSIGAASTSSSSSAAAQQYIGNGSTQWSTYYAGSASGTAPQAVMQILAPVLTVGIAVDVKALASQLGAGSLIDSNFQWSFGDPGSQFNWLPGYNASHIYTQPGTYTISLTVTNVQDLSSTVSTDINIAGDYRRPIYVNAQTGNDNNNGLSPGSAVQSAARADSLVGNNTEVFFADGQTFNLNQAFKLKATNILVSSYGSGPQPVINYTNPLVGSVIFSTNSSASVGVTVENVTMTTLDGTQPNVANQPMGVMAGGTDTSVVGCTFDYVEYDVNASAAPMGLTVEDNTSPIDGGLKGYFVWDQGTDTTVIGNYANGSVHEHVMRTSGATQIEVYDNDFNNFDGKGCIEIHVGAYAWVDGNTVNGGDIRVGPLGLWGEPIDTTSNCVIEDNRVDNSNIDVFPGAQNISIRSNIIQKSGSAMINLQGQDGLGRQSANILILDNTGLSFSTSTGQFLDVQSYTAGVTLENNLLVQPDLAVGGYSTAPVYVKASNLSSFVWISGNVWQMPNTFYKTANGGINWIGSSSLTSNYQTVSEWNNQPQVGTDFFSSTQLGADLAPVAGSLASYVDEPVPGVFNNAYGNSRSESGPWAAGAV